MKKERKTEKVIEVKTNASKNVNKEIEKESMNKMKGNIHSSERRK